MVEALRMDITKFAPEAYRHLFGIEQQIAAKLDISARTVEFHKYTLMESVGAKNTAELLHFAIRHGIVAG